MIRSAMPLFGDSGVTPAGPRTVVVESEVERVSEHERARHEQTGAERTGTADVSHTRDRDALRTAIESSCAGLQRTVWVTKGAGS